MGEAVAPAPLNFCACPAQTVALMATANNQIVFLTFHLRN